MRIKKIELNNIRSYEHEEVEFPEGSTLLSGDIGSGKTSVLLAIEFGLFGLQPGQRGSALLRNGAETGGVTLEFEIDKSNVIIERKLKRGKSISQDYSAITLDGKKEELSVTELKQRVLEILKYPNEFSKKQNLLYKFTVYTPQEEMKEIILEDSETRINTLRHVFGIDKYKTILENASFLRLKLREEKRVMEGAISNLDEEKHNLESKSKELKKMEDSTKILGEELKRKITLRKEKEKAKEEASKKIEERGEIKQELGKSKILLLTKKNSFYENEKKIKKLGEEIQNFKNLNFNEEKIKVKEDKINNLKKEKEKLDQKNLEINSELGTIKIKIEENKKLQETMSDLKVCPTCQQDVDAIYRANILNKAYNEISQSNKRIEEIEEEKKKLLLEIKKIEEETYLEDKKLTDLKIMKMRYEGITEKEKLFSDLEKENESLKKDLSLLEKHIENLNNSLFKFNKFEKEVEERENELNNALKEEKKVEIRVAETKKEIEFYSNSIQELKERISKLEEINKKLEYISKLENWINKKFVPVVNFLEKNVMNSLKKEFSRLFQEWFQTLVTDSFVVRLTDEFTPIIEQHDYELDYAYLSGGERTAIALAYRLALTQVINSVLSKIKTKDIIILDEPTDGFSEQQLDKMRGVLEQLKVKQLIIVSHEQKIESFVENIIKFKKNYGVSSKEQN